MSVRSLGRICRRSVLVFVVSGVFAAFGGVALGDPPDRSVRPVPKPEDAARRAVPDGSLFVEEARLGGHVSYVVADAQTGAVLESRSLLRAHPPASVAKALTALYTLDLLGPRHRFRTRLLASGPVQSGIVQGDLILAGDADPVLSSDHLFGLAERLKLAGVKGIKGRLLVYGAALPAIEEIDPGQPIQVGYNPAIGGLNLNFNRVFLEWKRAGSGYSVTMDARTEKLRPTVQFVRTNIVDTGGPVFTYQNGPEAERWTVERKALGKAGGRWLPVRRPTTYAGEVFHSLARSHGLDLPRPQQIKALPPDTRVLAEHLSPSLEVIARDMLKYSTNLTAEVLGLSASQAGSLRGSGAAMSAWMKDRFGIAGAEFADHSGLGDSTELNAREMVKALTGAGAQTTLAPILKPVRLLDSKGNLAKDISVEVVAKTGTLNFVSGLAGYIRTESGRDLAFAIFASDMDRRRGLTKAQRERPKGAKSWNGRAKRMQHRLIGRWAVVHELYEEAQTEGTVSMPEAEDAL